MNGRPLGAVMTAEIVWRFFLESDRRANAERALKRALHDTRLADKPASLRAYEKGGFLAEIRDTVEASSWEGAVFLALEAAQMLRADWSLAGAIAEELDLWAHKVRHPGLAAVGAVMLRNRPAPN